MTAQLTRYWNEVTGVTVQRRTTHWGKQPNDQLIPANIWKSEIRTLIIALAPSIKKRIIEEIDCALHSAPKSTSHSYVRLGSIKEISSQFAEKRLIYASNITIKQEYLPAKIIENRDCSDNIGTVGRYVNYS